MRIAFYAPMKAADHPEPSGDRTVALALQSALRQGGHDVVVPSRFRSYDRGDPRRQERLRALGGRIAEDVLDRARARPFDLWLTYHLYHKAPDWLGPRVAGALGIPYVVVEASVAGKRRDGPWHLGHEATLAALRRADRVIGLNPADRPGVLPWLRSPGAYRDLPPFLDTQPFAEAAGRRAGARAALAASLGLPADRPWMLSVAMMRQDQKLASYRVLAEALRGIPEPCHLIVVGDGPAAGEVRQAFRDDPARVTFAGAVPAASMPDVYAAADLYVWPAVKEAWSMALIEAQAAGLPVVAGNSGGVPDVVADGVTGLLTQEGDQQALGAAAARLLRDASLRRRMGRAAAVHAAERHDLGAAAGRLDELLRGLLAGAPVAEAAAV